MTTLGLTIIVLAWIYQLAFIFKGDGGVKFIFAGVYTLGTLLLVIGAFRDQEVEVGSLNLIILVLVVMASILIARKKYFSSRHRKKEENLRKINNQFRR